MVLLQPCAQNRKTRILRVDSLSEFSKRGGIRLFAELQMKICGEGVGIDYFRVVANTFVEGRHCFPNIPGPGQGKSKIQEGRAKVCFKQNGLPKCCDRLWIPLLSKEGHPQLELAVHRSRFDREVFAQRFFSGT